MVVWRGVHGACGVFFQTYSKSHSNRLLVVDFSTVLEDGVL